MEEVKNKDNIAKLRILNTAMNGCEFPLYKDSNLFVTKNFSLEKDGYHRTDLILPEEVVFLPAVGVDFNFEIVISEQGSEDELAVIVRELREEKCNEYRVELNTPFSVGVLNLAVAKKKTQWSKQILRVDEVQSSNKRFWLWNISNWKLKLLFSAPFFMGVILFLYLSSPLSSNFFGQEKKEARDLSDAHVNEYLIVPGTDKNFYVFTSSQEKAVFLNRYIDNFNDREHYIVRMYSKEEERVRKVLSERYPELVLYKISFDDIKHPDFIISAVYSSFVEKNKSEFSILIKKIMPYVNDIKITQVDDNAIVESARSGLDQLGVNYSVKKSDVMVSFIVEMNIDDALLYKFQDFVSSFYQKWGASIIRFNLLLQDEEDQAYSGGKIDGVSFVKKGDNMWLLK